MSDIQGSGVVWEEPPKPVANTRNGMHESIAAALKSRPGQWAKVMTTHSYSTASYIKSGRLPAYLPAGSFEAVARNSRFLDGRSTKVSDIYARYVGDPT